MEAESAYEGERGIEATRTETEAEVGGPKGKISRRGEKEIVIVKTEPKQ